MRTKAPARTGPVLSEERAVASPLLSFSVLMLAIALNQSGKLFGVNLSVADPLMIVVFLLLMLEKRLYFPRRFVVFFLVVLMSTTFTALVVTPVLFGIVPGTSEILVDGVKLLIALVYLVLGYNVGASGFALTALRWFSIGAVLITTAGVALSFLGVRAFDEVLYYSGVRFRGVMIDPNYFAVLACAAVAYFVRDSRLHWGLRLPSLLILAYGILMSGSKTGLIALLSLLAIMIIDRAFRARYAIVIVGGVLIAAVLTILSWSRIGLFADEMAQRYGGTLPQLHRVSEIFNDLVGAAAGGGSDRIAVWGRGIDIIETSPLVGAGVGSYGAVVEAASGIGTLAHNTYIQMAAEWGLPLVIVLLAWISSLLIRASPGPRERIVERLMARDIVIVFMIGSVSLSLNNARMFWFFLGILAFFCTSNMRDQFSGKLAPETIK